MLDWLITFPHYTWIPLSDPNKAWSSSLIFEILCVIPWIHIFAERFIKKRTGWYEREADRKRRGVRKATLWEKLIIKDMPDEVPVNRKHKKR
jgi:hypothetical protein